MDWVDDMNGMELITPSSISYTGNSASIGANGVVTTSGTTSISLNDVFSSNYEHYMATFNWYSNAGASQTRLEMRLRTGSSDVTSGYNFQRCWIEGSNAYPTRTTGQSRSYFLWRGGYGQRGFAVAQFYSPYSSGATPYSLYAYDDYNVVTLDRLEGFCSNGSSHHGFTIAELSFGYSFNLEIAVYGMVK